MANQVYTIKKNMITVKNESGVVVGFYPEQELQQAVETFLRFPSQPATPSGVCYGVDRQHLAYLWFKQKFMTRLCDYFQRDLKLVFGMYSDLDQPFDIHSDIRSVDGEVCVSCLIPVSVNYDPDLCNLATTDVFCESDSGGQPPPADPTLQARYHWHRGDLIWWDTRLYHSGGVFDQFQNKQAIVIHTYV
jgi:hypothetical protein